MASIITANDGSSESTEPTLVLGYDTEQESMNQVYDIIGGGIAVALVRPRPRSGTLRLFYLTEADADAARELHTRETTFSLVSSERSSIAMTYVLDGRLRVELDEETRDRWVVEVGYQEIET